MKQIQLKAFIKIGKQIEWKVREKKIEDKKKMRREDGRVKSRYYGTFERQPDSRGDQSGSHLVPSTLSWNISV